MWSFNRDIARDRLIDIACRRSTPNSLDDPAGQDLGELNQLLEQRFAQPVPPPPHLTWSAIEQLILSAPAPEPVTPWYRIALQPGQLAMASAVAGLAVALLAYLPVYTTEVPALEATIYARGGEQVRHLPPAKELIPSLRSNQKTVFFVDEEQVVRQVPAGAAPMALPTPSLPKLPPGYSEVVVTSDPQDETINLRRYLRVIETDDISNAKMIEQVRKLNEGSSTDVRYLVNSKEITLEQRLTMLEAFKQLYGGEGFLPGGKTQISVTVTTTTDDEGAEFDQSKEMLLLLMERELHREQAAHKVQTDKDEADEADESDEDATSGPRSTGRQP